MPRVLLIGLDGAEPSLLARWMDEGVLPHLDALRRRGCFLPCGSTTPPATFPAWTTCVTGVNPGRHGIVDFTRVVPGARRIEFLNRTHRRAPALWNVLSEAGRRVAVLGVPATYPPEPVNGVLVAGFDSPVTTRVARSSVWPPERFAEVRGWRFADFQESAIGPGWHAMALERLLAGIAEKERIACRLFDEEPWDFFMAVFGESDTVAHHFWLFHDTASPRRALAGAAPDPRLANAVRAVYRRLDEAVGALVSRCGDDVVVGVVSDHGFGGTGTGVVHLNNWLAEHGHLTFAPAAAEPWLKRAALGLTPPSWRGALFRKLRGLASRTESAARFGGIDWARTRAWSEELPYYPSVRVNLAGRDPDGAVPESAYDAYCEALRAELEAWEPVARVWRRDEALQGPYVAGAPDLVVELAAPNGYPPVCLRARGGPSFRRLTPEEAYGGKERGMTGTHRPDGVLLLSEPSPVGYARLEDVAPTVLACLGVDAPPMDGSPIAGRVQSRNEPASPGPPAEPTGPETADALEERLRRLGYFG